MKKIFAIIGITLISLGFLPQPTALANIMDTEFDIRVYLGLPKTNDTDNQPTIYLDDEENGPLVSFILSILNFAIAIMGSIAVILLIVAGFQFMIAQGNQQKLDEAKETVKYVVIGLIAALLSYIIVIFVQSLFISE